MVRAARLVSSFAVLLAACGGTQQHALVATRETELPIRRVILYQNGIGYFERQGRIDGDMLTLQVRPTQVNDILKSLTVVDQRDGRAVSVSLPLEKKAADKLAELPAQVRDAGGLLQVFSVFRGARVTIEGHEGRASGRVVGVEPVGGGEGAAGHRVTLKTNEGALVVYALGAIERVLIEDRTLEVGLDKSLDVALDEGNWKPVGVSVQLAGETPHDVVVSYISEMPLWKPAYRVLVGGEGALLQGFAVVDNVSGESWNKVSLSLVAGNPMSFLYDLHAPQYTRRADLTPRMQQAALAPVIEQSGMAADEIAPPASISMPSAAAPAPAYPGAAAAPPPRSLRALKKERAPSSYREESKAAAADIDLAQVLERQAPSAASTETVGTLARYDIADPVDVPDRSSTLVSLVNARVPGEEVVLIRPEEDGGNTGYAAVRFQNATPVTLEKGPVAMYASGTFLGESFLERMEAGTTTFLTYAAEGGVTLRQTQSNREEGGRLLKIVDGTIVSEVNSILVTKYEVQNRRKEPATIYVKTARKGAYTLRDQPKDTVETPTHLFVPMKVASGAKQSLELTWSQPVVRTLGIDSELSITALKLFLGSGKVPKEIAASIDQVLRLKARLGEITSESARLSQQHASLSGDQERVRDNLNLLRKTSGNAELMQSLVKKLAALEDQLGVLSGKLVRLSEEQAGVEARLREAIAGISLDTTHQ